MLRKKHKCYTMKEEWVSDHRKTRVEHIKYECRNGCCLNGHWNEFYEIKPSEAEIVQTLEALEVKALQAARLREQRIEAKVNLNSDSAQLITINLDQNYKQIIKLQYAVLDKLKSMKTKWMTPDATASFEYYGKKGNWNPHVHCIISKTQKKGDIAQALNRVFYEKYNKKTKEKTRIHEYTLYAPVDVTDISKDTADNYINGDKQKAKMDAVNKDREYRDKYNVPHTFKINETNIIIS